MPESVSKILELESKIAELRSSISELEGNLDNARQRAQREAIDHLEDYIDEVDTKFESFQTFWKALKEDIRNK